MHLILMLSRLNKIVWSFTLIATFAIVVNNTIFIHTHILADGRVLEHAHPFNQKEDPSYPFHKHNSKEFFYLDKIFHLFNHTLLIFILLIFYVGRPFFLHQFTILKKLLPFQTSNDPTRAPPVFSTTL